MLPRNSPLRSGRNKRIHGAFSVNCPRTIGLSMRIVYAALIVAGSTLPALAQHEPVIVIPGRPDVPVILNGYDVSGAVVEGDWGLERPGHVAPTIVDGPLIPAPFYARGDYLYGRGYYPATGRRPGYGRYEIQPPANRTLPPPAPSYHRDYGIES